MGALVKTIPIVFAVLLAVNLRAGEEEKGKWLPISDGIMAKLTAENKKPGWPGGCAGVTVEPGSGDVYVVVCDQGMWKSTDKGANFERVDGSKIGGRCETGFALDFDPAGKRLMCFMIYGSAGMTTDAGKTWQASKLSHLDFGAVDWSEPEAKHMISLKHESGGDLVVTHDAGGSWKSLGKGFKQVGIFEGGVLMATKAAGILRSTDDGQTWTQVSDSKPTGFVMRVIGGVGYWTSNDGLLASKDKGLTWPVQGTAIKAFVGPYFGKDASQIIVGNKEGLFETTDSGATWHLAAPLPAGFGAGPVGPNYAWDAKENILYASTMGKPAFKYVR